MVHILKCLKLMKTDLISSSNEPDISFQLINIVERDDRCRATLIAKLNTIFQIKQTQAIDHISLEITQLNHHIRLYSNIDQLPKINPQDHQIKHIAIICTSIDQLFPIAKSLLDRYYHCFIEKPMVQNIDQASILIALAQQNNCCIYAGWIERWNPILPHQISDPTIHISRLIPWQRQSKSHHIAYDLLCHDLDLLVQKHRIFQEKSREFRTKLHDLQGIDPTQADAIKVLFHLQSQIIKENLHLNYLQYEQDEVILEIKGLGHFFTLHASRNHAHRLVQWDIQDNHLCSLVQHQTDQLQLEYIDFIDHILGKKIFDIPDQLQLFSFLIFLC